MPDGTAELPYAAVLAEGQFGALIIGQALQLGLLLALVLLHLRAR